MSVAIDNISLPEVTDGASHPEFAASGYFMASEPTKISAQDPIEFWRVLVVPPPAKLLTDYEISVRNVSLNPSATGLQKLSDPVRIKVWNAGFFGNKLMTRPGQVFFNGPDAKHPPSALVLDNFTLAGWLMDVPRRGDEDGNYAIWLDNDFIERNYGAMNSGVMPGRCYTWGDCVINGNTPVSLTSGARPDAATFLIPGNAGHGGLNVELNTWHKSKHGGTKPDGWVDDPDDHMHNPDWAWPFDPRRSIGSRPGDPDLAAGNYVIISGPLIEDTGHLHPDELADNPDPGSAWCWQRKIKGHAGWLEIHPLDAIRRVNPPKERKTPQVVQLCDPADGKAALNFKQIFLRPTDDSPPTDNSVLRFRELIDPRFSDMSTVNRHEVEIDPCDPTRLRVTVGINRAGGFKAVYLLWWEESRTPRPIGNCSIGIIVPSVCPSGQHCCSTSNSAVCVPGCVPNTTACRPLCPPHNHCCGSALPTGQCSDACEEGLCR